MPEPAPTEAQPLASGRPPASPTATASPVPATPTIAATEIPAATATSAEPAPRVDHTSVDLFDKIPESYLAAAGRLRMVFIDRSVGLNISEGLDCLTAPSDQAARNHCRRVDHTDPAYSLDRSTLAWSHPGGYDRSRWTYLPWEGDCSNWSGEVTCFLHMVEPIVADQDVLSYQFSYLEVAPGSDIADPAVGFFAGDPGRPDISDVEAFEAAHPDKTVLYWTTSLARGIGSPEAQAFNDQMRAYTRQHGKPLFDVADILSHEPGGNPCYDNRDGIAYRDENVTDDGLDLPAICPHYTTETNGGHLGSVSAGKIRAAKAFWVLMAQVAGWRP